MEILETIQKRASLKLHLSSRQIEKEKIVKILDAARVAPSARNSQPGRFIVVTDKKIIESLVSRAFNEVNRVAKGAAAIIVACANPNDDIIVGGKEYYLFDLGLAVENIVLAATGLGLASHIMAGVDEEELKRVLGVPRCCTVSGGYSAGIPGRRLVPGSLSRTIRPARKEKPEGSSLQQYVVNAIRTKVVCWQSINATPARYAMVLLQIVPF